jgi:hypothetical protein
MKRSRNRGLLCPPSYEMSFAEVVRRGVEEGIKAHPPGRFRGSAWKLPPPRSMGKPLLPESEWDEAHRDEA